MLQKLKLYEKDFDSDYNNDWKETEGAPRFASIEEAREWLEAAGVEPIAFGNYRLI